MAENYKELYHWANYMLDKYQDEIVPGLREQLEKAKRPKGQLINERMLRGGFAELWGCDCSCCGETFEDRGKLPNFCPNCGADLRGDPE
jgi:rubrerythrin